MVGSVVQMAPPDTDGVDPQTSQSAAPSAEVLARRIEQARRVGQRLGDAVIMLMGAQRYRHLSLSDLDWMILPPLLANQLIVAEMAMSAEHPTPVPVGVTLWAKVSREVELKIKQQIAANVFPVKLKPEDWTSGDIVWLMDIVSPSREMGTRLFREFRKVGAGAGTLQVHPIVARVIDVKHINAATEATPS
jgi:cytolysin-activating lysine-acyltransferase